MRKLDASNASVRARINTTYDAFLACSRNCAYRTNTRVQPHCSLPRTRERERDREREREGKSTKSVSIREEKNDPIDERPPHLPRRERSRPSWSSTPNGKIAYISREDMPDSGAVYQPTTVGYTYDSGGDGTGGGGGGGLRHGFWRIMSRHKLSSRKWLEWVLLSVALCFFVAGLTTMLVSLVCADSSSQSRKQEVKSRPSSR